MSILKKTVLAGIGFASLTRQKAEELADYLIKSGELSQSEKKEAVLELLAKAEAKAEAGAAQAKDKIGREVEKARKSLGVAKTSEIEALTKRVEAFGPESGPAGEDRRRSGSQIVRANPLSRRRRPN